VKLSPSRAPLLHAPGETRFGVAATSVCTRQFPVLASSNTSLHRTPAALLSSAWFGLRPAPVSSKPLGRRQVALLALCVLGVGCSERLTPSRAGTIIRHSKAFLSGAPESHPVFDRVSALLTGSEGSTPERQEGDSYIVEFSYHWPEGPKAGGAGRHAPELTARVFLRRLGNSWAVDDDRSRALVPSWPQLPGMPNPFWPSARAVP
jgi:hypothetical protein